MNLVGKILTALIALFSVVFMTFALAVYATQTNWREKVMNPENGLQAQLKKEQDSKKEIQGQFDRLVAERDAERKAARDTAAALKTEAENLRRDNAESKKSLIDVQDRERKAVAAMTATQNQADSMTKEREQLRNDLAAARKEREDAFKKTVELTDTLHQTANELRALKEQNITIVQDLQKYKDLAKIMNVRDVDAALANTPPVVEALVMSNPSNGMLEISLGADAGLHKGHRLEVFRGPTYLGRVEVVQTVPDRSVCKVIPEYQKGAIQKGDHVASRL